VFVIDVILNYYLVIPRNSTKEIVLINLPSSYIPRIIILLSVKHFIR